MSSPEPRVGDWYCVQGGDDFEVVAFDADDGTIEIQYFDGSVEEMDIDDWESQAAEGTLFEIEAPDDWSGSVDAEVQDEPRNSDRYNEDNQGGQWARGLDGLDLFE